MSNHGNHGNASKFGLILEMTHLEIAQELGVTFQCIQATEDRALLKFRKHFKKMFPDTWELVEKDIISGNFGREVMPVLRETESCRDMRYSRDSS